MRRKICIVTGTRAEYGLLYWLIRGVQEHEDLVLQLVVTGMHLSPEFGLTYRQIEADGFTIDKKVEMLLSSDTPVGINKSIGLGVSGLSGAFADLKPDVVILLGDRFEIFAGAVAAMVLRIPIAHCHGGESTEGAIDEAFRHSITKMAQLHFVSTEVYRKRVIQLGEAPSTVFNVGALSIESIRRLPLLDRNELEERIGFTLGRTNFMVTFHPVTLEAASAEEQFGTLLSVLDEINEARIIFTKANADTDGRIINSMIDEYCAANKERAIAFTSMGQLRYLSALQYMDVVAGNSSSGLVEAPALGTITLNIGDRQKGRVRPVSVIDCDPDYESIKKGFSQALDTDFRNSVFAEMSPYGDGNTSASIISIIKNINLKTLLKKRFYDL